MKTILDDDLSYLIYSIVEEIPVRICCNLWSNCQINWKA
jgi:hypothetical protein